MCIYLEKKMSINYSNHINDYEDLKTTYAETRAGFIEIALEKNRQAIPFIEEARILQNRIKKIDKAEELINIPVVNNNIDIILLNTPYDADLKSTITNCENYVALGELKGGIDPAGADEHWKTAKSAIDRIRNSFGKHECYPYLFFIGAAIEAKMAREIYNNLKSSYIANAANLTKKEQIISIVEWLINI
jgi:hypothetical protein